MFSDFNFYFFYFFFLFTISGGGNGDLSSSGRRGSGGSVLSDSNRSSRSTSITDVTTSPRKSHSKGRAALDAVRAATKFLSPTVQHSLVTACATAFLNLSCTELGRSRILDDSGALQAVFHFLLGGSGGSTNTNNESNQRDSSTSLQVDVPTKDDNGVDGDYVNHCQKLSWDIVWNLLKDPLNHQTLVLNDFLRTVETLAVTARSDVEVFDMPSGGGGHKGSLDMDDHVLREIFNLIDRDGSNTYDTSNFVILYFTS